MRLRLTGQGESGESGAPPGDLYCDVHIKPHPIFKRQGDDVLCEVPITLAQAALGCTVDVPTLTGNVVQVKIPKGTQNGEIVPLRGKASSACRVMAKAASWYRWSLRCRRR